MPWAFFPRCVDGEAAVQGKLHVATVSLRGEEFYAGHLLTRDLAAESTWARDPHQAVGAPISPLPVVGCRIRASAFCAPAPVFTSSGDYTANFKNCSCCFINRQAGNTRSIVDNPRKFRTQPQ